MPVYAIWHCDVRGFPLEGWLHFRQEHAWVIVPIIIGLVLVFLYFWSRQDTAKDFVRMAEQGPGSEKPVGALAALYETLAASNKLAGLAYALIYGVLTLLSGLAAVVFIVMGAMSLFTAGGTLVSWAWQIGIVVVLVVSTRIFMRACRDHWRDSRAVNVDQEVRDKATRASQVFGRHTDKLD